MTSMLTTMISTTLAARPDDSSKYLVYAKLDNAKVLYNLAKSVNFKEVLLILIYKLRF